MKRYSIRYFLGQCFKGLWRNSLMSLASVTVLLSCLVLIGTFSALVYNANINIDSLAKLNEIVVIVDYEATDAEVEEIARKIDTLDNIEKVEYVSKEEGLASERDRYEEYSYLFEEIADENPLPDVFKITYEDNSRVANLVYQLGEIENVNKVNNRTDIANDVESIKSGVSFIFIWILVILFVISIFIIIITIKIGVESRSREISAMRYIGATNGFMMTPFLMEGVVIGLVAAIVGFFVQRGLYVYIYNMMASNYKMIAVVPFASISLIVIFGFLCIGILAGVLGSAISLRKYMKL